MSQENKEKLHQETNKLKTKKIINPRKKKLTPKQMQDLKDRFNQGRPREVLENPIRARIIYHHNGPKR